MISDTVSFIKHYYLLKIKMCFTKHNFTYVAHKKFLTETKNSYEDFFAIKIK